MGSDQSLRFCARLEQPMTNDYAQNTILIWLAVAASPSAASADAIVVSRAMKASTIAEFFVDERGVRVEIEVGASDLDRASSRQGEADGDSLVK